METLKHSPRFMRDLERVEKAIAAGADLEARNEFFGRTPIFYAIPGKWDEGLEAMEESLVALIRAGDCRRRHQHRGPAGADAAAYSRKT